MSPASLALLAKNLGQSVSGSIGYKGRVVFDEWWFILRQLTLDEIVDPDILKLGFHKGRRGDRPYKAKGLIAINKITESAIDVIANVGLRNCTVARIAEDAGCSRGLVQRYFTTLNELYAAIILVTYGRFLRRLRAKLKRLRNLDMAQWMDALVSEGFAWAQTDDRLALAELFEIQRTDHSIRDALQEANDVVQRLIYELVFLGMPQNLPPKKREKLTLFGVFLRRSISALASQEQAIKSAAGNDKHILATHRLMQKAFHGVLREMIDEISAP